MLTTVALEFSETLSIRKGYESDGNYETDNNQDSNYSLINYYKLEYEENSSSNCQNEDMPLVV